MKSYPLKPLLPLMALTVVFFLTGCSSIARGVTEAVMDRQGQEEDTRQCEIEGESFQGISQSLHTQEASPRKVTKVLMVHGISNHLPGYSIRLQKKLFENLGLTKVDSVVRTITLDSEDLEWGKDENKTLGTLRITRHMDKNTEKELLFYELTWSPITEQQKQTLYTDSANNEGLPRASLNKSLKSFMNATVPDLLIYNGNGYDRITTAVTQSVCWMLGNDWGSLPESGSHQCETWNGTSFGNLAEDDHFFITHSLGSRITIDTIQNFASLNNDKRRNVNKYDHTPRIEREVRRKEFTVFMMSNQLPLLQMGRAAPDVSSEIKTYCSSDGTKAEKRVMRKMNIVAFSDPNDIFSYPVPLDFTTRRIDSRICPMVTNVSLNIAEEKNLFDAASFANPLTAHSGYMEDDRVIELIANGISQEHTSPLIKNKCKWIEAVHGNHQQTMRKRESAPHDNGHIDQ